ncbi:MAG: polysulfide reductase NrfD [Chloroflexi bacterium]|nr:polysulfide reductase NrfD [Chloroflexota bacterium]
MEAIRPLNHSQRLLETLTLAPLRSTSKAFYLLVAVLLGIIAWGVYAYSLQLRDGLILTGMRDRISWGLYIAMYVFFVGASMAGTFVSAILRITKAGWRTPVTRAAEMVTVAALPIAFLFILFNSRQSPQWTIYKLTVFSRWESPIAWDMYALTTYLTASLIYLYVALIPDLAYARDHIGAQATASRRWFLKTFAIGWQNGALQRRYLQLAETVMMILVLPIAVAMHTVTAWLFAMTLREPWDNPMFGIYFVGGAIFSGVGIIVILIALLRKVYRLESFITRKHFLYLGYLLAALAGVMFYFNVSDFVTHAYKLRGDMSRYLEEQFTGPMAPLYWAYFWGGLVAPIAIVLLPFTRNIAGIVVASVLVNVAMFIERYLIVVGGLGLPLNPYEVATYSPTWVEWSLLAAGVAVFMLIVVVILKLVPALAITEMMEENRLGSNHDSLLPPLGERPGQSLEGRRGAR